MKMLLKMLKETFKISKSFYLFLLISVLLYSVKALILVYTPTILLSLLSSGSSFKEAMYYALGIIIINMVVQMMINFIDNKIATLRLHISLIYDRLMANKVMSLGYEYIEDPDFLDLKERAIFSVKNQGAINNMLYSLVNMIQSAITLITLVSILAQLGFILIMLVLAYLFIYTFLIIITFKMQKKFYLELIPINRRFGYYVSTLLEPKYAKDYRLYNASNLVVGGLVGYQKELAREFTRFFKKMALFQAVTEGSRGLIQASIYFYVAYKLYQKVLKVSEFSLFTSSALNFMTEVSNLISSVTNFLQNYAYVTPYLEILAMKDESDTGDIILDEEIKELEFRNVCFTYPRQDKEVLTNISFKINEGELISLVGLNGAGKSTIIKLICRFYKPTSGTILINGRDLNRYEINSYYKKLSCVFQDFKLFSYSILENVVGAKEHETEAYTLLEEVGLKEKIDKLPKGLDTCLNKQIDEEGTYFSGGEGQKVAIARALYKKTGFIVLDEPTSALDPKSEASIYENFKELTKGKTAIYVSHRMSSSTFCDKILVIENGKVADFAPHKELMKRDCLYKKLFMMQAKNYES